MKKEKNVFIAFLGNAHHDTRVTNLTSSLKNDGYKVKIISFDWQTPGFKTVKGETTIYKLSKTGLSFLFYFKFKMILFYELIRSDASIYFAEDIYTLPFVTIIAKLKRGRIIYNSRELYSHLAGLVNKSYVQGMLKFIERIFIKSADYVLTTGEMDSNFLEGFYNIKNTVVIRNLPPYKKAEEKVDFCKLLRIPEGTKIILYQGVVFNGRGIVPLIKAIKNLDNAVFVVLGGGDQREKFNNIAVEEGVGHKVFFPGTIEQNKLINYTAGADLGVSLIENISLSYYYALPNKLFEYIMAEIPVLTSDLPQMKKIIDNYNVGKYINLETEKNIAEVINNMIEDENVMNGFRQNCKKASEDLCWENEFQKLQSILTLLHK